MQRRNQPLHKAARFLQSEVAATLGDHAVMLACLTCVLVAVVALVGRNVEQSFGRATRQIGGTISTLAGGRAPAEPVVPGAVADPARTQPPPEHYTLVVALLAVGLAFIGSRLLRSHVQRELKDNLAPLEQGPNERYIYVRRQKILQKLFNNTDVLFKCRLLVRDLMSEEVEAVPSHTKLADLAAQIAENRLSHVFVVSHDGQLMGIIHQEDLANVASGKAKDIMAGISSTVRPDEPLTHAISMILNEDRWTLPVVEDGRLRGEITRTDLAITLQCVFQVFLRIGQFAQCASAGEENVANSVRAVLAAQREKLNALTKLVAKYAKEDAQGHWRNICQGAEGLLDITKRLAHDVEKAREGLDQRMQCLMTLFVPRIDALTGLCTRKGLEETLDWMSAMNRRYGQSVSLMLVRFMTSRGPAGEPKQPDDAVRLSQWGKWLDTHVRETDLVARYADDIFGIVLPHTDDESARLCQTRLRQEFPHSLLANSTTLMIAGTATVSANASANDLMTQAELALKEVSPLARPAKQASGATAAFRIEDAGKGVSGEVALPGAFAPLHEPLEKRPED